METLGVRHPDPATKIALVVVAPLMGVSEACRLLDLSRDTYYRLAKKHRERGFTGLLEAVTASGEHKPRLPAATEAAILAVSEREPRLGKTKVAARVTADGITVSASAVWSVWKRHKLTHAEQRIARARDVEVGKAAEANWRTMIAEQRRLAGEVAQLAAHLTREPRRTPARSVPQSEPLQTTAVRAEENPGVWLMRELFGVRPTTAVEGVVDGECFPS